MTLMYHWKTQLTGDANHRTWQYDMRARNWFSSAFGVSIQYRSIRNPYHSVEYIYLLFGTKCTLPLV
jgi:hypothetical protein